VINGVFSADHAAVLAKWFTGTRIYIEPREVAARDVDTNPVAFLENVRRREWSDDEPIHLTRFDEVSCVAIVTIARPDQRIRDVHIEAAGEVCTRWIDIDQLGSEVSVDRHRRCKQYNLDRANNHDVLFERLRLEDEHVLA
jgi:hypothetical protein